MNPAVSEDNLAEERGSGRREGEAPGCRRLSSECPRVSGQAQGSPPRGVWAPWGAGRLPAGQSRSSPHEGAKHPLTGVRGASRVSAETLDRALGGTDGAGRRVGLNRSLPLLFRAEDTKGLWSESQPPRMCQGAEGLHGAWGGLRVAWSVTWIGPSLLEGLSSRSWVSALVWGPCAWQLCCEGSCCTNHP